MYIFCKKKLIKFNNWNSELFRNLQVEYQERKNNTYMYTGWLTKFDDLYNCINSFTMSLFDNGIQWNLSNSDSPSWTPKMTLSSNICSFCDRLNTCCTFKQIRLSQHLWFADSQHLGINKSISNYLNNKCNMIHFFIYYFITS